MTPRSAKRPEYLALAGRRLRRERELRGLSLREIAGKAGTHPNVVMKIEHGHDVMASSFIALCLALDVSLDQLFAPSTCANCDGVPPPGFRCETCGTVIP